MNCRCRPPTVPGGSYASPAPTAGGRGFPLAGRAHPADRRFESAEPGVFELTCTSGAEGKMRPLWLSAVDGRTGARALQRLHPHGAGRLLWRRHAAYPRWACRSTPYDKFGIRTRALWAEMEFEAAWGAAGAICVAAGARCRNSFRSMRCGRSAPGSARMMVGESCTEAHLSRNPAALLMNRSPQRR